MILVLPAPIDSIGPRKHRNFNVKNITRHKVPSFELPRTWLCPASPSAETLPYVLHNSHLLLMVSTGVSWFSMCFLGLSSEIGIRGDSLHCSFPLVHRHLCLGGVLLPRLPLHCASHYISWHAVFSNGIFIPWGKWMSYKV